MKDLLKAILVLLMVISGVGYVSGFITRDLEIDPIKLTILKAPRTLTVSVFLRELDDRYRWLSVYGCPAEVGETGSYCTGEWERESTQEIEDKQYLVTWRNLPRGTMRITAMAFDSDHKILAQGQTTVFRGE